MSEPEDMCTDCTNRRTFAGRVGLFVASLVALVLGFGGKKLLTQGGKWVPATDEQRTNWIEEKRNDPEYLKDQPALRQQILDGKFENLEIYERPANAVMSADYCYATIQFCLNYYCTPGGRRCQRDYRCWSESGGYWYNKSNVFPCPSCPCPRM